jgi:hypothetical protein
MDALIVVVLALGAMAAAGFELWLVGKEHPRRFQLAWVAWTPLAMVAFATFAVVASGTAGSVVLAVLAAPLAYPICRAFAWLDGLQHRQADEDAKNRERMKYRAMDFGGPPARRPPAPPGAEARPLAAIMAEPMTATPAGSVLARATTEKRSALAKGLEGLVIGAAALVAVAAFFGNFAWSAWETRQARAFDIQVVGETVEAAGFAAPRVQAYGTLPNCPGYVYRWRAAGAAGRACVDYYEERVTLWVEQRWPPMRASAPTAVVPPQ